MMLRCVFSMRWWKAAPPFNDAALCKTTVCVYGETDVRPPQMNAALPNVFQYASVHAPPAEMFNKTMLRCVFSHALQNE